MRALLTATMCASVAGCFPDYAVGNAGAGTDGGAAGDVQPGKPWCQRTAHTFCFDFDEGPIASGWDDVEVPPPATFAEDGQDYTSAPKSGLLSGGGAGSSSAAMGKALAAGHHLHCEADVRVDAAPPEAMYLVRVDIETGVPSAWYHAELLSDRGLQFDTSAGPGGVTETPGDYTGGGWHRVMLDLAVSPTGSDGQASGVTITGGLVGSTATLTGPGVPEVTGFGITLGPTSDVASVLGSVSVRYDDVACDVSP